MSNQLILLLQNKFGMRAFRPGQLEAIQALMEQNRLLCIQPTGYGKSLVYQLPSCVLGGITLVISPLLALMRDQIDQLKNRFQIPAASVNSDQTEEENAQAKRAALMGEVQILFTSPEQLDHIDRFEFLLGLPIRLLVIDEAHCISTWGHDFRPSYRHILQFAESLKKRHPELKILGLTATADERAEKDIAAQLSSAQERVHVWREKMDRPNIYLSVCPVVGTASKLTLCKRLLSELTGHGLIYCATRENTELVAEYLQKEGFSITAYHAGLESEEKRKIQTAFSQNINPNDKQVATSGASETNPGPPTTKSEGVEMPDRSEAVRTTSDHSRRLGRGERIDMAKSQQANCHLFTSRVNTYQVIAATTALGMGIDKKDLRFVIHFDIPGSITAYYQEVGRAGRDGLRADGILLYDKSDRKIQEYFIDSALPSETDFQMVLNVVRSSPEALKLTAIKRLTGLHPTRVTLVLAELLDQQFLMKESVKGTQVYKIDLLRIDKESNTLDLSRYTNQHLVKSEELNKIVLYAEQKEHCRMALLRKSLGDPSANHCERCDLCLKQAPLLVSENVSAQHWLSSRIVPIAAAKTQKLSSGFSLFDSKLRTPAFLTFMKKRAMSEEVDLEIVSLLMKHIRALNTPIGSVVILPSKTWKAQSLFAKELSERLNVPLFSDLLVWKVTPEKRQGELLNNDQRHENVHEKMKTFLPGRIPSQAILLFDDYIGSGATMKEAARALRKTLEQPLIPVTIAAVKWHLGKAGFI